MMIRDSGLLYWAIGLYSNGQAVYAHCFSV